MSSDSITNGRVPRASGQALVELALVMPILLLLLIAVYDVGRAAVYSQRLSDAAFQGARVASILEKNGVTVTAADVTAAIAADLPADITSYTVTTSPSPLSGRKSGNTVTITLNWTFQPFLPGAQTLFPSGFPLRGTGSTVVR